MNELFMVVGHLLHVIARLMRPGGTRTLIAENLLLKQQMVVLNRGRSRAPNVPSVQKLILGFLSSLIPKRRLTKASVSVLPLTTVKLASFDQRMNFSNRHSVGGDFDLNRFIHSFRGRQ
ncbi:MAG: hypothetical protein HOH33_15130 [Verrucomicrobia bacterium]|jgi:putative transposase|nr:hypothetical protein [Verrucomicrobiota bacterium]